MDKDNFNANVDFVRGQADMIVLSALSDTGKYGLEILNTINERSKGMYSLKQATLYSSLKRLEKNGYVHSYDGDTSNGAKRVYYGLTQMGREYLENDKSYWEFCNFLMSNLISDNKFDPDSREKPFDPAEFRPLTRRARGEKEDKEQPNEQQDKEKEVVVKYVYVKSEDIPEGADIVYVSPENIQDLNNKSNAEDNSAIKEETVANEKSETQRITTLSDTEYQSSFILLGDEDYDYDYANYDIAANDNVSHEVALVDESANEVAVIEKDLQVIEETSIDEAASVEKSNQTEATTQEVSETQANEEVDSNKQDEPNDTSVTENSIIKTSETSELIAAETSENVVEQYDSPAQEIEPVEDYAAYEDASDKETSSVEVIEENNSFGEYQESAEEASQTAAYAEETHFFEDSTYYNQESTVTQDVRYEDDYYNLFANRPLHNSDQGSSVNFSSLFSNYSRENDVNYVESFSELFDVEDEDDLHETDTDADIKFLSMKEMVYKYQSKGINIKPYDKRNTMEYYVNRYYFSNKLQFHASIIIFAIFALEFFIGHFICNRGANKSSDLWLLMIFAFAIFPAVRSVMYVIDPTRKSLANYNPKTSFLISLLPVVTFPIVFALMGFVQFGANIDNYESMERAIILPSVLLFNVPLFSIIYTLLYRTYKYHVN